MFDFRVSVEYRAKVVREKLFSSNSKRIKMMFVFVHPMTRTHLYFI